MYAEKIGPEMTTALASTKPRRPKNALARSRSLTAMVT